MQRKQECHLEIGYLTSSAKHARLIQWQKQSMDGEGCMLRIYGV